MACAAGVHLRLRRLQTATRRLTAHIFPGYHQPSGADGTGTALTPGLTSSKQRYRSSDRVNRAQSLTRLCARQCRLSRAQSLTRLCAHQCRQPGGDQEATRMLQCADQPLAGLDWPTQLPAGGSLLRSRHSRIAFQIKESPRTLTRCRTTTSARAEVRPRAVPVERRLVPLSRGPAG